MVDNTTSNIYNKNAGGTLDLISSVTFKFIDYFRNPNYKIPGFNDDFSLIPIRSADGKTVIKIKVQFKT
jgi:hypothetical protein